MTLSSTIARGFQLFKKDLHLETFLDLTKDTCTILSGDINININIKNKDTKQYLELLENYGFSVSNDKITRSASNAILDHFITNNFGSNIKIATFENILPLTDHNPIILNVETGLSYNFVKEFEKKYTNIELFLTKLEEKLDQNNNYDINNYAIYLQNTIIETFESSTITKLVRIRNCDSHCPYFNYKIARIIKKLKI